MSHPAKQTATLTFSDLCVESSTVGIGGGGRRRQRPLLSSTAQSVLKNVPNIAHSHAQPTSPSPFLVWERSVLIEAENWLIDRQ